MEYLTILNGFKRLKRAITSSSGNLDGNKLVATNNNGKIDVSFLPPNLTSEASMQIYTLRVDTNTGELLTDYFPPNDNRLVNIEDYDIVHEDTFTLNFSIEVDDFEQGY